MRVGNLFFLVGAKKCERIEGFHNKDGNLIFQNPFLNSSYKALYKLCIIINIGFKIISIDHKNGIRCLIPQNDRKYKGFTNIFLKVHI